jgi:hypothetical protein
MRRLNTFAFYLSFFTLIGCALGASGLIGTALGYEGGGGKLCLGDW